jgi:hypothetical protein
MSDQSRIADLEAALSRCIRASRQYAEREYQPRFYGLHMLTLRECEDVLRDTHPARVDSGREHIEGK